MFPVLRILLLGLCCVLSVAGCATVETPSAEQRAKAANGDAQAQLEIAEIYDSGSSGRRNPVAAAVWYRKAAEQGSAEAQNGLGSILQFGEGMPQNYAEALEWYRKSAAQGLSGAKANLGYMYDAGLGVQRDQVQAAKLYREAAEQGNIQGMQNLGISYWHGEGLAKDNMQAYQWLDLARFRTQQSSNSRQKWQIRGALDELKKEMSKEQISVAEAASKTWYAAQHFH